MKLPDALTQFIHKTPQQEEAYLSLVLEADMVHAAVWTLPPGKKPHVGEARVERIVENSWEKRLEAADRAIARLADKEGRDDFEKVVLGLPAYYLSDEDEIQHDIRTHIKTLTEELELTPIGFIPIHQAIVHMIKQEEGVPPSVILLEVGPRSTTMILYKVGAIAGRVAINNDDLVPELERVLKGLKELEVLPSRVHLYGGDQDALESYKRDLLKHPWPTRANFLHYPKIDVLPQLSLAGAVSLAGASELASQMGEEKAETATQETQGGEKLPDIQKHSIRTTQMKKTDETKTIEELPSVEDEEKTLEQEERVSETDENVVNVSAETLGFRRDIDIVEQPPEEAKDAVAEPVQKQKRKETLIQFLSRVKLPKVHITSIPKSGIFAIVMILLFLGVGGWLTYWVVPKVSVKILQVTQMVSASSAVSVNPSSTVVDIATKTVPGRKQEKTVSGDKTIAVTGKKDMGEPARGTVTVYNKSLTGKQLKKGTILTAGSLSFSLDSDVSIASASESLASGSVTYGKANATITATTLGPQSNLPASTEFSVKDTPSSVMVARNDVALSLGRSNVVTVVSRADYDTLVTDVTRDLIVKAKAELASSVEGRERLIDETVKTTVTQKKFDAELDQETKELHGSITLSISGISYSEGDVASLFVDMVASKVPAGYTIRESGAMVNATGVKIQKDGSIGVSIEYQSQAVPTFDLQSIRLRLAGMSLAQAQDELKSIAGVGGIEIGKISRSLWGPKLPANPNNISLSVAELE